MGSQGALGGACKHGQHRAGFGVCEGRGLILLSHPPCWTLTHASTLLGPVTEQVRASLRAERLVSYP